MLIFRNRMRYTLPFIPVFLCGSKYHSKNDEHDKRNILKNHIEKSFPYCKAIILERDFRFGNSTRYYLGYDNIFLRDLLQVEHIAAVYAKKIIIIHETISTGVEVGMFAVFSLLAKKMCVICPDEYSIEEDKLGNVIKLAFLKDQESENYIHLIKYYPDVEVFRFSKNKSDYYNYFHNNEIGPELGRKISLFIKGSLNEEFNFSICRCSFDKVSSNSRVAQYFVNEEEQKVHVFIHPDTLLIHLCALILLNKSELRKPKKIIDHVDYIHKEYTGVLKDSIVYYDKNELSLYEIKVQMNIPMSIELRQAIGYFLYMLQGMKLIHLEAKDTRKMEIRKIKFSQELLNMEDNLRGIIAKQEETEFARNVL